MGFGGIHPCARDFRAESMPRITEDVCGISNCDPLMIGSVSMGRNGRIQWGHSLLDTHLTIVLRNHGLLMTEGTASSMSGCVLMKFRVSSGNSLEVAYFSKEDEPAQQLGLKRNKGRGGLYHALWQTLWMNCFSVHIAWGRTYRRLSRGSWTMHNATKKYA